MSRWGSVARAVVERCRLLASYSEEPGRITRTYLSAPMKDVHDIVGGWLSEAGCVVSIDAVGNLRATTCRADPLVRGRPPGRPPRDHTEQMSLGKSGSGGTRADQGVRPTFVIGSHLDTVPNAGAFDGVLGVVL